MYVLNGADKIDFDHLRSLPFRMQLTRMGDDFRHIRVFIFCHLPFYNMFIIKYSSLIYNSSPYTCDVDNLQVRLPC